MGVDLRWSSYILQVGRTPYKSSISIALFKRERLICTFFIMLELKDDDGLPLPQEVQDRVNQFIDKIPTIPWFKPSKDLKKEEVEKQATFTLECFGIKASIEYRSLTSERDWASARDSVWASVWASGWALQEVLLEDNADFKTKYPNWAFKQLFKLWEMGLYPVGVLEDTKTFVIYIPPCDMTFPDEFK